MGEGADEIYGRGWARRQTFGRKFAASPGQFPQFSEWGPPRFNRTRSSITFFLRQPVNFLSMTSFFLSLFSPIPMCLGQTAEVGLFGWRVPAAQVDEMVERER